MQKKPFAILLALILTFCLATMTISATEENTPTLTIKTFSLSLQDSIYINCKVSSENISDVKNIKVLVWESLPEAYTIENDPAYTLETLGTEQNTGYEVFRYTNLKAKELTKVVYFCAYYEDSNGNAVYSAPKKYSVLTYAYNKINSSASSENLIALCKDILDYGASAQTYLGYQTDFLANATVHKISVVNGTLEDGFTSEIYQSGTQNVVLTANAPDEGYKFSHWENSAGTSVGTEATLVVDVNAAETYTAVYEEDAKGILYTLSNDKTYYIVSGLESTCTDTEIVIPSTYNGKPVKEIGEDAFKNNSAITSVTIPNSVTAIGSSAFYYCTNLNAVEIPNSVITIGASAFYYCRSLTAIEIPSGVQSIGNYAFCSCRGLTNITIPNSVKSIGDRAFSNCTGLTSIVVDANNEYYMSSGNCLIEKASMTVIQGYKNSTIPSGVQSIGNYAFYSCSGLTNITIPNSVKSIGDRAFSDCTGLTSIIIPSSVEIIGYSSFKGCSGLLAVAISPGVKTIDSCAFDMCTSLVSVTIPNTVTGIGAYAFYNCRSLTGVVIPDSVISIDEYAFHGCSNLVSVTLPNGIKTISNRMFSYCRNLAEIKIPDGVTKIDVSAFSECSSLASIVIPKSVTTISSSAFSYCPDEFVVYYGGTQTAWTSLSSGNSALTNATRYYYSENKPTTEGNFWYYDNNGEIAIW